VLELLYDNKCSISIPLLISVTEHDEECRRVPKRDEIGQNRGEYDGIGWNMKKFEEIGLKERNSPQ
jgi:hypothetical protein